MILVTGGSGFMGQALARRLIAAGRLVRVVDLAPPAATAPGMEFAAADICDCDAVAAAMRGIEAVVHLAARVSDYGPPAAFERLNVGGTRTVAAAARAAGVRRFVHMSSVAVFDYRRPHDGTDETTPIGGHEFAYGATKARAEIVVRAECGLGLPATIVRPGLFVYGPGDRKASAPMLAALAAGVPLLVGGGRALLSTSYVDNLIDGVMLALDHPAAVGEVFHLADDARLTWHELAVTMLRALGRSGRPRSAPRGLAAPAAALLEGLWSAAGRDDAPPLTRYRIRTATTDLHFSNAKARRVLGFRPAVGVEDGVAATVAWFRSERP